MMDSNATPEQNRTIVKIIVILAIILTSVGASFWVLASQVSVDSMQGCSLIAFILSGIMSKWDCLSI
jgi:hypothetical protein